MNSVLEKANVREEIATSTEFESARLKTLQEVHRLLDQALNLEDAITRVFMLLDERHKLQSCMLSLLEEQTREVRVAVAVGVSGRGRAQGRYQLGEGITGRVVVSGRPVIVPQVSDEPLYLNRTGAIAAERDERAFICVPVNAGGRTIGARGALLRQQEESDISLSADLLSVVAALIGQALRLEQTARRPVEAESASLAHSVSIPSRADLGSLVGTSSAMMTVL